MATWCREEEEEEGFWLDPSYPRVSTQNGLDEAWRLIGEEEEEGRESSKNEPSVLSKSKSKGSRIRSGLKKVVANQLVSPGSGFVSSLLRRGRWKKSSNGAASSAESAESSADQDSPCLVRDSVTSASSSSASSASRSSRGESSFDADSPTSSVAVATFLALEKDSPGSMVVVPDVRKVEQRFVAKRKKNMVQGSMDKEKEHRRKSSALPMALCFPVLWV